MNVFKKLIFYPIANFILSEPMYSNLIKVQSTFFFPKPPSATG